MSHPSKRCAVRSSSPGPLVLVLALLSGVGCGTGTDPAGAESVGAAGAEATAGWAVEAEAMSLSGYVVEANTSASGGRLVRIPLGKAGATATASSTFTGSSGVKTLTVFYYDENYGTARWQVSVAGVVVDAWSADQDLSTTYAYSANSHSRTSRVIPSVQVNTGDVIAVQATANLQDWGNLDNLTVNGSSAPADFSLSASPSSLSVARGASATSTVAVVPGGGFTGAVALSASGLPMGVTATFSPASTTGTSTLTLAASSTAAAGTSTITVTGVSGALTHTAAVSLAVTAPQPADFSLSALPSSLAVVQGSSGAATLSIARTGGFTGSVAFSVSALPAGVTATFAPASTTGTSSGLTLAASSTATVGTATVTVTGTSGTLVHTTTVALNVTAASAGTSWAVEAEAMSLSGYVAEANSSASGGTLVRIPLGNAGATATATTAFTGASGVKTLTVFYYDENYGTARWQVSVGGVVVDSWNADQNLSATYAYSANSHSRTSRVIPGVEVDTGATIVVQATANLQDWGNLDDLTVSSQGGGTPAVAVAVTPSLATTTPGGSVAFHAAVTGTTAGQSTDVTWAVPSGGGSSISAAGVFQASTALGTFTVSATSVADPTKVGTATVTVSPTATTDLARLRVLAGKRIFFQHASVGGEVCGSYDPTGGSFGTSYGLKKLITDNPGSGFTVASGATTAAAIPVGTMGEVQLSGVNGDPAGKLSRFQASVRGGLGGAMDYCILKLGYPDFTGGQVAGTGQTPAQWFAGTYKPAMDALAAAYPTTTFVHVTAPLYQAASWWDNPTIQQFNALLRASYPQTTFDLADLESRNAAGVQQLSNGYPCQAAVWANGDNHLNLAGANFMAGKFLTFLAGLP
jgi:hypothetical protein